MSDKTGINEFEKSCCFTGYRPEKFPFRLDRRSPDFTAFENRLIDTVFSLPDEECFTFYSGMAMGFDIVAAEGAPLKKAFARRAAYLCSALCFAGDRLSRAVAGTSRKNFIQRR